MEEIFRIANQLQANGQTPTTALIKARLSQPQPMPVIISALQRWKSNPEQFQNLGQTNPIEQTESQSVELSSDDRIQQLEQEVMQLRQQIAHLSRRLSMLEMS